MMFDVRWQSFWERSSLLPNKSPVAPVNPTIPSTKFYLNFLPAPQTLKPGMKPLSLEEALNVLMSGFLRGGVSFLKGTGEMIKGTPGVNREVRVGVTHVRFH